MNPIEEQYLRKSKSTFMSAGWGINKRSFNNAMGSKSTNKLKTDRTQDSSPKTQKLNNHKSFTNMKTLNDNLRGFKEKNEPHQSTEIIEHEHESDDDNWIGN